MRKLDVTKAGATVRLKNQDQYGPCWAGAMILVDPGYESYIDHAKHPDMGNGGFQPGELEFVKPARDYVADHMRRTLRRDAGMTKEQAAKFTANTPAELRGKYSRKIPGPSSTAFMSGPRLSFSWSTSPEGYDYWSDVSLAVVKFRGNIAKKESPVHA